MPPVRVIILHGEPGPTAGPLERMLAFARAGSAVAHAELFRDAGADDVTVLSGPPDDVAFGTRLAPIAASSVPGGSERRRGGLVVLGAGSIPLARPRDIRDLVRTAASKDRIALANNRYSADVVAIARADGLPPIPPLPGDNALPRWLEEIAGWEVRDLRGRWRLGIDLDSPLDILLVGATRSIRHGVPADDRAPGQAPTPSDRLTAAADRIAAVAAVLADRRAEVVVAGRTNARSLAWLERRTAARIRALVEERGLRASSRLALADAPERLRGPRSVLALVLDREGPAALGRVLAELGDAAIVDSRVLLAHRLGSDETAWPSPEDRFASDLLDPSAIADPWLRDLTAAALDAPIPVLLGGHTLVGPGVRLVARAYAAEPPSAGPRAARHGRA